MSPRLKTLIMGAHAPGQCWVRVLGREDARCTCAATVCLEKVGFAVGGVNACGKHAAALVRRGWHIVGTAQVQP